LVLEKIVKATEERVKRERRELVLPRRQKGILDFRSSLERNSFAIIAEYKPSSPSGVRARWELEEYLTKVRGAAALSVLTEPIFFKGSYENLRKASMLTDKPVLFKDFVVDEFQLSAAHAYGADAVLLMLDVLGEDDLKYLALKAKAMGLQTLVEVSREEDAQLSEEPWVDVLGVNSRDFKTLKTDIRRLFGAVRYVSERAFPLAESGLKRASDAYELALRGYRGALVGTSLMESPDPRGTLMALKLAGDLGLFSPSRRGAGRYRA